MTAQRNLAYHEAGHVIAWLHYGYELEFVSIDPIKCMETTSNKNERCDGWVSIKNNTSSPFEQAVFTISGCVAEAKSRKCNVLKCIEEGGYEDDEKMEEILDCYYGCLTEGLQNFSIGKGEPRLILTALVVNESRGIIHKEWIKIDRLAHALLKRKTLTYDEIIEILHLK